MAKYIEHIKKDKYAAGFIFLYLETKKNSLKLISQVIEIYSKL